MVPIRVRRARVGKWTPITGEKMEKYTAHTSLWSTVEAVRPKLSITIRGRSRRGYGVPLLLSSESRKSWRDIFSFLPFPRVYFSLTLLYKRKQRLVYLVCITKICWLNLGSRWQLNCKCTWEPSSRRVLLPWLGILSHRQNKAHVNCKPI